MTRSIRLEILGIPIAKQSFRFGKPIKTKKGGTYIPKYQTPEIEQSKKSIAVQVLNQLGRDFVPFSKYVKIDHLEFCFPPQKNVTKKLESAIQKSDMEDIVIMPFPPVYKTTKPDLDNLEKNLWDALNGLVFIDDSLICAKRNISKRYSYIPRIVLQITGE